MLVLLTLLLLSDEPAQGLYGQAAQRSGEVTIQKNKCHFVSWLNDLVGLTVLVAGPDDLGDP